jgi:Family of unknown function (DUF6492)
MASPLCQRQYSASLLRPLTTRWVRSESLPFNVARSAELVGVRAVPQRLDARSALPLDVIIPVAEADCDVLGVTIEAVMRNLAHPVGTIWAVTAPGSKAAKVADDLGCEVVDERGVLPITRDDISYQFGSFDRSGWLFQQLLKLSADTISPENHVLILDADTVMIRPQTFTSGGRVVLFHAFEYNPTYFEAYRSVTGLEPATRLSCTTHHMVMRRDLLVGLKELMEKRRSVPWWQAVLDTCVYETMSGFSEYEVYGNFALTFGDGLARRWWRNAVAPKSELADLGALTRRYGTRLRTVSFHHYL